MRKSRYWLSALLLLVGSATLTVVGATDAPHAKLPVVGLSGSAHDFSSQQWSGGDLCIACHAQDRSEFPAEAPLWNPSADFNRTFADALQPGRARGDLPGPGTMTCMRCHDGTMAGDMFGGLTGTSANHKRHAGLSSTSHGGTNHPVGIAYPQFDEDFRPQHQVIADGVPLPNGQVECTSCHDPHNEAGRPYMLVRSNERSALCLTCHKK
ncbi:MAG: hypothetical protein HJJLKODD_00615 [Phycisphaerae bacterium]|nr:hypothetical protein [Phycisphaerae bacterium]